MLRNASETLQGISFFATVLGGAAVTAVTLGSDRVGTPGTIVMCLGVLLLTSVTAGLWYYLKHVAQPATYRILKLDSVLDVEGLVWNKDRQRLVCGRVPLERSVDTAGGTVEYRVTVERPRRHYSYGLRWHWGPQRLEAARSSALRAV
jgi:hypothetical protein